MPPEQSYAVARALHETRVREGWRPIGRKIGFTNRSIWSRYGVYQPIWGTVYDRTLIESTDNQATVALEGLCLPRIEPEICFKLRGTPRSANNADLLAATEWVAHSVEIVQCDRPGWKTSLEHSISFNGLHGRLILGSRMPIDRLPDLEARLPRMEMILRKGDAIVDRGHGEIVLGSPLAALGHLVRLLSTQPQAPPLAAGEIISTGTLTDAHPVAPGEAWSTEIHGLPLSGMRLAFT
jgi:2-oxo-3-hexenedioate decarboxylase